MTSQRFLIDVDGVVCDFVSTYLNLVLSVTGRSYTLANVTDWSFRACLPLTEDEEKRCNELLFVPGVVHSMASLNGAYQGIAKLQELGEVVFVTSPWVGHPTWAHERERWIHDRWPDAPIISTNQKHMVVGDWLIDDKPSQLTRWWAAHPTNGKALLWDAPYNQGEQLPRVTCWEQVVSEVGR